MFPALGQKLSLGFLVQTLQQVELLVESLRPTCSSFGASWRAFWNSAMAFP